MEYKDYYKTLGVGKNASTDEIKKQYKKSARKYHPDINKAKDAEQRFKDIGEAYEVLKDSKKRKAYDRYGSNWKDGQQQQQQQNYQQASGGGYGAAGGFDFGNGFDDSGQFSDFFDSLFGGGRKRSQSARQSYKGEDINVSMSIPIEDAYTGSTRLITFQTPGLTPDGQVSNKDINLNVKIPKGIKKGQKIRLAGQGSPGFNGEPAGDMYIEIGFQKHPLFYANGANVYINLPVIVWEATLGKNIDVPTPISSIKVTLPVGITHGKKLRLKGKGIPAKIPGDLYLVVNIVFPPANSAKAKKIYEAMKELDFDPREKIK
jgi:curved DNA-binding protein